VLVPFWSSLLIRTFAWEVLLRDTGIVNSLLLSWGFIEEPLTLMRNTLGVILGMSQILLPFMVLPLFTVMRRIDPELTRAAANLGAPPFAACRSACRASSPGPCSCSCWPSASTSPPRF
jgi:putative spermidine/putrescine transport system permease protein